MLKVISNDQLKKVVTQRSYLIGEIKRDSTKTRRQKRQILQKHKSVLRYAEGALIDRWNYSAA